MKIRLLLLSCLLMSFGLNEDKPCQKFYECTGTYDCFMGSKCINYTYEQYQDCPEQQIPQCQEVKDKTKTCGQTDMDCKAEGALYFNACKGPTSIYIGTINCSITNSSSCKKK